jgi:hypothetical protein
VLLDGFAQACQLELGKNFNNMGSKWKAML